METKGTWLALSSGTTEQLCFCLSHILSANLCIRIAGLEPAAQAPGGLSNPGFQGLLGDILIYPFGMCLHGPWWVNQTRVLALVVSDLNKPI